MSWKRPVSILVVTILTGLPVSGTTCALLCGSVASGSATGHHHGSTHAAEEPARPSSSAQIQSVSDHDCRMHDDALRQAATAAAWRSEQGVTSIPLALVRVAATLEALTGSGQRFHYSTPPGTAPPTATPLVLRV